MMRLSFRFILPLVIVLSIIAYITVNIVDEFALKWFSKDIGINSKIILSTLQDNISENLNSSLDEKLKTWLNRTVQNEKIYSIGFCTLDGRLLVKSNNFPSFIKCFENVSPSSDINKIKTFEDLSLYISFLPLRKNEDYLGHLLIIHDITYIKKRINVTKIYLFYFFVIIGIIISIVTVLVARIHFIGWRNSLRSIIKGNGIFMLSDGEILPEFKPIVKDLRMLIRNLEGEKKTREDDNFAWTPQSLREILNKELAGDEIIIVSNREPYSHVWKDGKIEIQLPASGLVTALEPIMRACSGVWIAHGSGSADREVVDKFDHVKVPPNNPSYEIRRVWLTKEEEENYYYGFSNEVMWPLCHIVHTRPIFKRHNWDAYIKVNKKFAKIVFEETKTKNPVILIQDYHFAILPRLIREKIPNAIIITFWHIPWPNWETFGICPWREEIIDGLLGSSILGFHTRYHCNNFIDTVDRYLECRVDKENNNIIYGGKLTEIKSYPISIEWFSRACKDIKQIDECKINIRIKHNLPSIQKIGVGVDRLDYTKGILEKFLAVERLLNLYPEWIGKFTFIQIASPSRSMINRYKEFEEQVKSLAKKINAKFSSNENQPILLIVKQHSHSEIYEYYRASQFCFVNSLHDGMNLVAKEFIDAREDELGVLILSQFTGASRELAESIIVNPYDIDECAHALQMALIMNDEEQQDRMKSMRAFIHDYNVYKWAGRMLLDAAVIRKRNLIQSKMSMLKFKKKHIKF